MENNKLNSAFEQAVKTLVEAGIERPLAEEIITDTFQNWSKAISIPDEIKADLIEIVNKS